MAKCGGEVAGRLTARQLKMISLMAEGISHEEIAKRLGVGLRTVDRWAARSDVKRAIADAQAKALEALGDEIYQKCKSTLTKALPKSIRRVVEALDHEDARIQIRAAELIAKISGFYTPATAQPKPDQGSAEQDLKRYLTILEATNGNANQRQPIR